MTPQTAIGIATVVVSGVTIIAIVAGPILALRIQRKLDEERETKNRKLWIFKTLMAYRATKLNPSFVQALNMIDIEFTDQLEKPVRDAWKELQDHYAEWGRKRPEQRQREDKADIEKSEDLLAELLVRMGSNLEYPFDKVYVKKAWYYPEGLGNVEQEQQALRRLLLNLLSGGGAKLPVAVFTQDFEPVRTAPAVTGTKA